MACNSLENEVSESMNFHPERLTIPKVALNNCTHPQHTKFLHASDTAILSCEVLLNTALNKEYL
jgi:hypothetical protein